ncbi:DUF2202 domain-containing protein [Anaerobacillus sp. CMMVII]|uniref:ferritin-like domain-containing protein n=1 Tax=Anaerobacillus sp. CMMVII TaxID=2755588 RepID=UPI0021B7C2E4|nr:DUF2202 domain-containing protein [Anaerobacillus sp. CMMVII]MCT8137733.1 DUF2202 domain-containing protein [Anaerobacillus sp. CMMVII]
MKTKTSFIFMFFLISLFSVTVSFAQDPIPENYGAKGALADSTITLEEGLIYALEDEYLAQARYDAILEKFGDIRPFNQIKRAEQRHIAALLPLFKMYKVSVPENVAKKYVIPPNTLKDAFLSGVDGEIDNIKMYEKLITIENLPEDVRAVFQNLADASIRHLEAFKRGLSGQ